MIFLLLLRIAASVTLLSGANVIQTPPDIIKAVGHSVTLQCSHDIGTYDQILWYQQRIVGMQLIGYMSYETPQMESGYDQIKLEGSARPGKTCKMVIPELSPNSNATYYCAASSHGAVLFESIKS